MINEIINEDCITGMSRIGNNSIDSCVTDPPYNYELVGREWDHEEIKRRTNRIKNSNTLVNHIPYGGGLSGGVKNERWYQKNADNIRNYVRWVEQWGSEVYRILKPGAYCLVFNSTRSIAHVQVAMEKSGFYARDLLVWEKNGGIPKGANIEKQMVKKGIDDSEMWAGWHSCLRNEWEAISVVQKPLENSYLNNIQNYGVGALNAQNTDGSFKTNILRGFSNRNNSKSNTHCTPKPLSLIKYLVQLVTPTHSDSIVIDPFMGSGTTAIAALDLDINYVGFEIVEEYFDIINERLEMRNFLDT